MNPEPPDQQNFRDEYKLVFEGYKFFVSTRFITAAFMMSIQSALLNFYNQTIKERQPTTGFATFSAAMLFLIAMLIVERRTTSLFHVFLKRGIELESHLGLPNSCFHEIGNLSRQKGLRSFVTHTWGINILYFGVLILWVLLLVATITKKSEPEPRKEQNNVTNISFFPLQR